MNLIKLVNRWHRAISGDTNYSPIEVADFGSFIGAYYNIFDPEQPAMYNPYWCIDKKTGHLFKFEPQFNFNLFQKRKIILSAGKSD